jgi:hypothetical protein
VFAFNLAPSARSPKETPEAVESETKPKKISESEFISDKFKATAESDLVEVQENMTKLGMTTEGKTMAATGKEVT